MGIEGDVVKNCDSVVIFNERVGRVGRVGGLGYPLDTADTARNEGNPSDLSWLTRYS